MSLMTMRHKLSRLFIWLTCLLTFYLGFNQQIMCFELNPNSEIFRVHLQLIECNPLSRYTSSSNLSPDETKPYRSAACPPGNGCPACMDFHLSFKRKSDVDLSYSDTIASYFSVTYFGPGPRLMAETITRLEQTLRGAQSPVGTASVSSKALRATILLI